MDRKGGASMRSIPRAGSTGSRSVGLAASAALGVALLAPGAAGAWTQIGGVWDVSSMPIQYTVGPGCEDFADEETVALVQRVFQRWEDIDCAHISFEYIGRGADHGLGGGGFGFEGDGYSN